MQTKLNLITLKHSLGIFAPSSQEVYQPYSMAPGGHKCTETIQSERLRTYCA